MSLPPNVDREKFEATKKRVMERWGDELSHPRLKAKLGFDQSLIALINKCMTCPEEEFDFNVHRLLWSIPDAYRDDDFEDDLTASIETAEYTTPIPWCGVFIISSVIQGKIETVEEMDYRKVFNAILNLCNRLNILIPRIFTEVITDGIVTREPDSGET